MLKAKVNIQVLKVDRSLITLFKHFSEVKRFRPPKWAFSLKSLVRIASYGPQIDQSHGENRLSHIIKGICACSSPRISVICRRPDRNVLLLLSVCCHVERSIFSKRYEAWKSNLFLDLNLIIFGEKVCLTYPQIVSPNRIARFFLSVCAVLLLVKSFPSLPLLLILSM